MPSELLTLKWADIDWECGRFTVRASKTEHHEGQGIRIVPIFPELRTYLNACWDAAAEGAEHVIVRYRDKNFNLRTQLERIIGRAGLKPWPKLFQNLRATRATELVKDCKKPQGCRRTGGAQRGDRPQALSPSDRRGLQTGHRG
jgi:integrase